MTKTLFNGYLEMFIGVRRTCCVCGLSEEWEYDLEASQRDIVSSIKNDGWFVGTHGMKCPTCYEKRKPRSKG